MNAELVATAAAAQAVISIGHNLKPDFTRAQFSSNARLHTESRCNHCGFRIRPSACDNLDHEEQEHALNCRGAEGE